jgi:uncharacterized protein YyaL (SSP411 family)
MTAEAGQTLYQARARRTAPHLDRKTVVSWNGLAISAFARAALVLGDGAYAGRASRAADFVSSRLTSGGRLRRSAVDGRAGGVGYLDDYAFMIQAQLDLFETTGEARWLRQAIELQTTLDAHFWDASGGGYFLTPDDGEKLLVREKPDSDGAEPAGNSVAILNLLRLAELSGDDAYRRRAEQALSTFAPTLVSEPVALPAMLSAIDFATDTPKEIAIVKPASGAGAEALLAVLRSTFVPTRVLVIATEGAQLEAIAALVPWARQEGDRRHGHGLCRESSSAPRRRRSPRSGVAAAQAHTAVSSPRQTLRPSLADRVLAFGTEPD